VWNGLLRLASGLGYGVESAAKDLGGAERMLVLR
jgi:hypothetical protein